MPFKLRIVIYRKKVEKRKGNIKKNKIVMTTADSRRLIQLDRKNP